MSWCLCLSLSSLEGALSAIVKQTWEQAYLQAALEEDSQKMPQRILAARGAVVERFRDLEGNSDHHAERHRNRGCTGFPDRD